MLAEFDECGKLTLVKNQAFRWTLKIRRSDGTYADLTGLPFIWRAFGRGADIVLGEEVGVGDGVTFTLTGAQVGALPGGLRHQVDLMTPDGAVRRFAGTISIQPGPALVTGDAGLDTQIVEVDLAAPTVILDSRGAPGSSGLVAIRDALVEEGRGDEMPAATGAAFLAFLAGLIATAIATVQAWVTSLFVRRITQNTVLTVGPSGDFAEPGAASRYLANFVISPGVRVDVNIAAGTYACTTIIGHPQGSQVYWNTPGINGSALTLSDLTIPDLYAVIQANQPPPSGDGLNRIAMRNALNAAKASNASVVRAKYQVVLEYGTATGRLFTARNSDLGTWGAFLAINTGTASYGVTTGTGNLNNRGDGNGGAVMFNGACFYGFDINAACDYGGVVNCPGCLFLFGDSYNMVTDFAGTMYGADVITVGANYGYRANHGGTFYGDRFKCRAAIIDGVEVTDTAGFARVHNCDIQGCASAGVNATWGGSAKCFAGIVKNNLTYQCSVSVGGVIDARGVQANSDPAKNIPYGIDCSGGVIHISNTFDVANGNAPINTIVTGHTRDVNVDGNGGIYVLNAANGGLFYRGSQAGQLDAQGWLGNPGAIFSATTAGAVPKAAGAGLKFLRGDGTWQLLDAATVAMPRLAVIAESTADAIYVKATDDTPTIQAKINAARDSKVPLHLPGRAIPITATLVIDGDLTFFGNGGYFVPAAGVMVGVQVGGPTSIFTGRLDALDVRRPTLNRGSGEIGIAVVNASNAAFYKPSSSRSDINMALIPGNGQRVGYCDFYSPYLSRGRRNLTMEPTGTGYAAQNSFHGGRWQMTSTEWAEYHIYINRIGSGALNHNFFRANALEGAYASYGQIAAIRVVRGSFNYFDRPRTEGDNWSVDPGDTGSGGAFTNDIIFDLNAQNNEVRTIRRDTAVVDNGVGNIVDGRTARYAIGTGLSLIKSGTPPALATSIVEQFVNNASGSAAYLSVVSDPAQFSGYRMGDATDPWRGGIHYDPVEGDLLFRSNSASGGWSQSGAQALRPTADNLYTLGSPGRRPSIAYLLETRLAGVLKASLGGTAPTPGSNVVAQFNRSDVAQSAVVSIVAASDQDASLRLGDPDSADQGRITYRNVDDSLQFSTAGTGRLEITSAGILRPLADNTTPLASSGRRFTDTYSIRLRPGTGAATWTSGSGTPEGSVTAAIGSLYTRTDGGAGTTLYIKESGTGATGWVAK